MTSLALLMLMLIGQQGTIPEDVAQGKNPSAILFRHVPPMTFEELMNSTYIVRGRLINPRSYLDDDQNGIWTDYELVPTKVLVDRDGSLTVTSTPGALPQTFVTVLGGEIVINGKTVRHEDGASRRWSAETELLLFVLRTPSDSIKHPRNYADASSMFKIWADGTLEPMRANPSRQLPDGIDYRHINDVEAAILKAGIVVHQGLSYIAEASYWDEAERRQVIGSVGPFVVTGDTEPLRSCCRRAAE